MIPEFQCDTPDNQVLTFHCEPQHSRILTTRLTSTSFSITKSLHVTSYQALTSLFTSGEFIPISKSRFQYHFKRSNEAHEGNLDLNICNCDDRKGWGRGKYAAMRVVVE